MVGALFGPAGPDDYHDDTIPDPADAVNASTATGLDSGWSSGAATRSATTQKKKNQDTKVLAATIEERRIGIGYVWNFSKITNSA